MSSPLQQFAAALRKMTPEQLDAARKTLNGESVGGGVKTKVETEVVFDFLREIEVERGRRQSAGE